MKNKLILMLGIGLSVMVNAQFMADAPPQKLEPGGHLIGIGTGYGGYYGGGLIGFRVSYEAGVTKIWKGTLGIGGMVGYGFDAVTGPYYDDYYRTFYFAPRGTWHINWGVKNLDTYASVSVSFESSTTSTKYHNNGLGNDYRESDFSVLPTGSVGAAYYFGENIAVFAEFGTEFTYLIGGLHFSF